MQNQSNSHIDLDFIPMQVPTVKGRYALERLKPDAFPMYVTPIKEGVEVLIREGHPFMIEYPYVILNTQFRERFKTLLQLTNSRKFTLHTNLTVDNLSAEDLSEVLMRPEKLLPINLKINITMVIYEKSIQEMLFKNIIESIKGFFGTAESPFLPNIIPAKYVEVKDKKTLSHLGEFLLSNSNKNKKLLILQKYGSYKQNKQDLKNTDAVYLAPTEDIWGTITSIKTSTKFLPGETLKMADLLLIKFGETELPFDLAKESLAYRGIINDLGEQLIGAKVLCRNIYLPTSKKIIISKLLTINF